MVRGSSSLHALSLSLSLSLSQPILHDFPIITRLDCVNWQKPYFERIRNILPYTFSPEIDFCFLLTVIGIWSLPACSITQLSILWIHFAKQKTKYMQQKWTSATIKTSNSIKYNNGTVYDICPLKSNSN